jgi:PPM family protein phosphatase
MASTAQLEIANVSDVGRRRPHNEDSTLSDLHHGLAILADGMGGYKAGEVASAIAVKSIYDTVCDGLNHIKHGQIDKDSGFTLESLLVKDAIIRANSGIYNTARADEQCQGMGTTVVVCLFHANYLTVAHVGDSRLYRKRAENFRQITKDHSLIQELIDRGLYTPEEAMQKTPKNLVTRALGIDAKVEVDVLEEPLKTGDIYLLCSDGLNDMVNDEEIHLTLSKYSANLAHSAEELIRLANSKGGKDNISVILIRVREAVSSGNNFKQFFTRLFEARGK